MMARNAQPSPHRRPVPTSSVLADALLGLERDIEFLTGRGGEARETCLRARDVVDRARFRLKHGRYDEALEFFLAAHGLWRRAAEQQGLDPRSFQRRVPAVHDTSEPTDEELFEALPAGSETARRLRQLLADARACEGVKVVATRQGVHMRIDVLMQ